MGQYEPEGLGLASFLGQDAGLEQTPISRVSKSQKDHVSPWDVSEMALLSGVTGPSETMLVLPHLCKPVGSCFTDRHAASTLPRGHARVLGTSPKGGTGLESISFREDDNIRCLARTNNGVHQLLLPPFLLPAC